MASLRRGSALLGNEVWKLNNEPRRRHYSTYILTYVEQKRWAWREVVIILICLYQNWSKNNMVGEAHPQLTNILAEIWRMLIELVVHWLEKRVKYRRCYLKEVYQCRQMFTVRPVIIKYQQIPSNLGDLGIMMSSVMYVGNVRPSSTFTQARNQHSRLLDKQMRKHSLIPSVSTL